MSDIEPRDETKLFGIRQSTLFFLGLLAATAFVEWFVAKRSGTLAWLLTLALMTFVVISAGKNIKELFFGFLIDERNRYSLSRLQMVLWTLVVLSAYLTAVSINIHHKAPNPLAIAVPRELWLLMGISVTSLLGSPLLLNQRRNTATSGQNREDGGGGNGEDNGKEDGGDPALEAAPATAVNAARDDGGQQVTVDGEVVEKQDPKNAQWSDLFKGETANNFRYLDISRLQMFYFTFILVIAYSFALGQMFSGYGGGGDQFGNPIESLPVLSGGMVALLGISHTAYLGYKAVPSGKKPDGNGQ